MQNQAVEARVRDQQIAAASEHKERDTFLRVPRPQPRRYPLRVCAATNQRAGPPMPSVVNGASGLFSSTSIVPRLHRLAVFGRMD